MGFKFIKKFDLELAGLLLFLLILPFHLVIKKLVPSPWGTYWKEILLGLLLVLWAGRHIYRALKQGQRPRWPDYSPLQFAVLIFLALPL